MKKVLILAAFALISFGCGNSSVVKNTTVNAPAANTQTNVQPEARLPRKRLTRQAQTRALI